jgi:hypothetical protein
LANNSYGGGNPSSETDSYGFRVAAAVNGAGFSAIVDIDSATTSLQRALNGLTTSREILTAPARRPAFVPSRSVRDVDHSERTEEDLRTLDSVFAAYFEDRPVHSNAMVDFRNQGNTNNTVASELPTLDREIDALLEAMSAAGATLSG